MDNQHQKIKGYRDLSQGEIDLMNKIKAHAEATKALVAEVHAHIGAQFDATNVYDPKPESVEYQPSVRTPAAQEESDRLMATEPYRWKSIATTDFQTAFMALVRAVAQPTTF